MSLLSHPLLSSPFRPFYLLGSAYAVLLSCAWLSAFEGTWQIVPTVMPLRLWHGHEMVFGFAAAIITGILLTALPSWAGTEEIHGRRLAALALLWLIGRLAFWSAVLPAVTALINGLFFPLLLGFVTPQLARVRNRLYWLLLPILLALAVAQGVFQAGFLLARPALAEFGLRGGLYAILVLFTLKGGLLTPVFTGNDLRARGRGDQASFSFPLECICLAALFVLALLDLAGAPAPLRGAAALACALTQGIRMLRWRGWRLIDVPLVLAMHLGFAWLVLAFLLKAAADLTGFVPEAVWIHAFTVGALGLMMLGLMTRVSQRHTGRALVMPPALIFACALMMLATLLRLTAAFLEPAHPLMAASAVLWGLTFLLYFLHYASILIRPSLPAGPGCQ